MWSRNWKERLEELMVAETGSYKGHPHNNTKNEVKKMKEKKQIIYTINKKKHLLISFEQGSEEVERKLKKIGGIYRGVQEEKSATFTGRGFTIVEYLIPIKRAKEVTEILFKNMYGRVR